MDNRRKRRFFSFQTLVEAAIWFAVAVLISLVISWIRPPAGWEPPYDPAAHLPMCRTP